MRQPLLARATTIAITLLALSGCGDVFGPTDRLADAHARWRRTRPTNYRFTLSVSCFCVFRPEPVTIEVHGDSVVSRLDAKGQPIDPIGASAFRSIDGLLDALDDAYDRDAEHVEARFDSVRGYPTHIAIDYREAWADDEISYVVVGFQPL
jgi:hypothetical protein